MGRISEQTVNIDKLVGLCPYVTMQIAKFFRKWSIV